MRAGVIAPPSEAERGLFSESNDNIVAIPLSYGSVLLAGDTEVTEEEYMSNGPYTRLLIVINVPKLHTFRPKVPRPADRGLHPLGGVSQNLNFACAVFSEVRKPSYQGHPRVPLRCPLPSSGS